MEAAPQMINLVITAGIFVWLYVQKKSDKTSERLDRAERDLTELKSLFRHMPSHEDLKQVYESLNKLSEQVNQFIGESRAHGEFMRMLLNRLTEKGLS
ncbi:MAG: hypothetical protein FWH15_06305 [Betaproteobacteria bacterium]|nr:hypothetical protein [Betaproteobacteria bacterium]